MPVSPRTRDGNTVIVGRDYDRWTVLSGPHQNGPHWEWMCRCQCGTEKMVRQQHLLTGASKGCIACRDYGYRLAGVPKEVFDKLAHVVDHAIARCTDRDNPRYSDYGRRGIQVRFKDKRSFIEYLLTLPGHDDFSLVIDRIDNNGHYEVGNLRFITHLASAQNKRRQKLCVRPWQAVRRSTLGGEHGYYISNGFAKCFKRLHDRGLSFKEIGELYCANPATVRNCVRELETEK